MNDSRRDFLTTFIAIYTHAHIHTYIYIQTEDIYLSLCVCVRVCVCVCLCVFNFWGYLSRSCKTIMWVPSQLPLLMSTYHVLKLWFPLRIMCVNTFPKSYWKHYQIWKAMSSMPLSIIYIIFTKVSRMRGVPIGLPLRAFRVGSFYWGLTRELKSF